MSVKNITRTYRIRGDIIKIKSKHEIDDKTGKVVFNEHLDNIADNKALNRYRRAHHVIFPDQIKQIRKSCHLSQRDFAALLGWSPTTVVYYEGGLLPSKSHNKTLLLIKDNPQIINKLYQTSKSKISQFGQKQFEHKMDTNTSQLIARIRSRYQKVNGTQYTGYVKFNLQKFANLVIYFASHISNLTTTKLCKLLYYSDFLYYNLQTVSITGTPYVKLPHGPVPDEYRYLYRILVQNGIVSAHRVDYSLRASGTDFSGKQKFNDKIFSKLELKVIRFVLNHFRDSNAASLSKYSHQDLAWQNSQVSENISYDGPIQKKIIKQCVSAISK